MPLPAGVEEVKLPGLDGAPVQVRRLTNQDIRTTLADVIAQIPMDRSGTVLIGADSQKREVKLVFGWTNGHWSLVEDGGYNWEAHDWFVRVAAAYSFGGPRK